MTSIGHSLGHATITVTDCAFFGETGEVVEAYAHESSAEGREMYGVWVGSPFGSVVLAFSGAELDFGESSADDDLYAQWSCLEAEPGTRTLERGRP